MLRCPSCGDTGSLEVAAKVWVTLLQHNPDNIESEPSRTNGDFEWDDNANAVCVNCRWSGRVIELDPDGADA